MGDGEGEGNQPSAAAPVRVPYDPSSQQSLSEWSVAIYEELRDWAEPQQGRWEFWNPDYLVLTISSHLGFDAEPVVIDTYEGELTITFGYWEAHLPDDGLHDDTDSERAAVEVKKLATRWFRGEIATAIYFNADDKWCGSKMLDNPTDAETLADIAWIESFKPVRVELRKARKSEWRHFRISNGNLSVAS